MTSSPESLRRHQLSNDPAAPWLTWCRAVDHARIELSGVTIDNWIAKLGSFLTYECDVTAGDFITVDLPRHWLTPLWIQAAWSLGIGIDLTGTAEVVITSLDRAEAHHHTGEAVWLSPIDPWGMPVVAGETGEDAISLVRNFGDAVYWPVPDPQAPAIRTSSQLRTGSELASWLAAGQQLLHGVSRYTSNATADTEAGCFNISLLPNFTTATLVYIDSDIPCEIDRLTAAESASALAPVASESWWR